MSRGQTRGGDLGGVVYREHAQYPVFAPGSSKVTVGCGFPYFLHFKSEFLYSQQKQDLELTVAQIMNSLLPNSDLN